MWNYLTTPYLFTLPGVETAELEPWNENRERWRRLHVTFPNSIATHTAEQTFYYDTDGLQRRHDYTVDVNAGAVVAHYTDQRSPSTSTTSQSRSRYGRRSTLRTHHPHPEHDRELSQKTEASSHTFRAVSPRRHESSSLW
jgi:hypothetical protein